MTIRRYPVISLADARTEAKRVLTEHLLGNCEVFPITSKEAQARLLSACESKNKPRAVKDYKRLLTRHFRLGKAYLNDVAQQEIIRRTNKLSARAGVQDHVFVETRTFLRWVRKHNYIDQNPLERLSPPAALPSRDRILTDGELTEIYIK